MKELIKKVLRQFGIQIKKYPDRDYSRRIKLFHHFSINSVFDIGANTGQYALHLRELGYRGKIVSFEPITEIYSLLERNAAKDSNWTTVNTALGDNTGETDINIAGNNLSSSILDMLPAHEQSAPDSAYKGRERIRISTLDSVFRNYYTEEDKVFLKIDTQGFEKRILDGAVDSISDITGIQLEMSLNPLYEGEVLFMEMYKYVSSLGFKLYSIEPGFSDPVSGQLHQADGVFFRE